MRIALLEDDPDQVALVQHWLLQANHGCHVFETGEQLLHALARDTFDLLMVDWGLSGLSGIEVVVRVRERLDWRIPILFVTARDREEDIVQALQAGADDYMIKPVRQMELLARISALQRRGGTDETVEYAPYRFIRGSHSVAHNERNVQLTAKEYDLAEFLFRNAGKLLSRGHILESVWGQRADLNTRTVDTHISLIRQKLDIAAHNGWQISTVYRHGYRLEQLDNRA
jgi:two-component system, OmpR family, response regulator RegX3